MIKSSPVIHARPDPKWVLGPGAREPYRSKPRSLGFDLHSCETMTIGPNATILVPTGLRCQFNYGWGAFIWDRSGMGFKGIHRFAGVIESDYRGLWGVVLFNSTNRPLEITPEKAVAQVVFQDVYMGGSEVVDEIDMGTDRGQAGFGSTDK